ncbi:MAG: response regulator [Elusimicrobia bacterium]|nr:response regulator [Elusimicrobiota bacterium]
MHPDKNEIYVLDDEPGVRQSIETILIGEGYHVQSFATGLELIKNLNQSNFSSPVAALVDLRLPDMSGVTVMEKIREHSPQTEVIMLTGNPDLTSAVDSVNAGAYAYILKPYNMDEIKNILNKIFEKARLIKENQELTERLKKWNEKLEEEVHRRTVALNESYQKLQTLYDMRTQFISIMSHELRTPATAVMGFADTLKDGWSRLSSEKIKQYLDVLSLEASRMVRLMSEIFEISKIQEGKLIFNLEELNIMQFLRETIQDFRNRYPQFSIGFIEGAPVKIKLDPVYFKSVLSHILMNSIKYSKEHLNIMIFTEKKEQEFIIRIEDDGPGVPRAVREKAFEPFFRSMDDVNRKTPGAGLGLTIARGILNSMNGAIQIVDKLSGGEGCAVEISLPLKTNS